MKITHPLRNVVHFIAPTQRDVCLAFVRVQEFYESPDAQFRSKAFARDEFLTRYAQVNGSNYLTDWNGFNVPGNAVMRWVEAITRAGMTFHPEESPLIANVPPVGAFYFIGTWGDGAGVIDHELCHAVYMLDIDYRTAVYRLTDRMRMEQPVLWEVFKLWMRKEGYDESVMRDELNAYMSTSAYPWFAEAFGAMADKFEDAAKDFRALWANGRATYEQRK